MEAVREEFESTLVKMKSEDGERKRQAAKRFAMNMEKEWDEGGDGYVMLRSLEQYIGLRGRPFWLWCIAAFFGFACASTCTLYTI